MLLSKVLGLKRNLGRPTKALEYKSHIAIVEGTGLEMYTSYVGVGEPVGVTFSFNVC